MTHADTSSTPSLPALQMVRPTGELRRITFVLKLLLLVTVVALFAAPWQQTSKGSGRVIAFAPLERQQTIEAPIDGRVVEWRVQEGSVVTQGELLLVISDNDPEIMVRLQSELDAAKRRLESALARGRSLQERIDALTSARGLAISAAEMRRSMAKERQRAAKESVDAAQAAWSTAELQLGRQQALKEKGLASERDLELATLDLELRRTELNRAEANLKAAEGEVLALEADLRRVGADNDATIDAAQAELDRNVADEASAEAEIARMEVRLARQSTQRVVAPRDGVVMRLLANQGGELVKSGDPLLTLVPDTTSRAVEIWVDGNDAPLIQLGMKTRLQFEGWPAVQFSGWPSVAVGTFGGVVSLVDAADDGKGKFRVLITPDPEDAEWPDARFLRQGGRANGWVLLNQVSLGYELWRQLNGFPPALDGPTTPQPASGKPSK